MSFADRKHSPLPWRVGNGCIVSETKPDGTYPDYDDMAYYGGHCVCESIGTEDAEFIVLAIRQRDIYRNALYDIFMMSNNQSTSRVLRAWDESYAAQVDVKVRTEFMRSFFSFAHWSKKYKRLLQLPETATRARIEPAGFLYWHSGRFVTDNIEITWARMGNDRSDCLWPWIDGIPVEECEIPF